MEHESDLLIKIKSIFEHIVTYVKQSKEVIVLSIIEKVATLVSDILGSVFVVILIIAVVHFASIALALHIGLTVDNLPVGFLIVALIYLIILLVYFTISKKLILPNLVNLFIKQIYHGYANKESE